MVHNIMNEYIKLTKKHILQYMKLIFENQFNRKIFEEYFSSYINVRYYDLNENKSNNTLKNEILNELEKTKRRLLGENQEKGAKKEKIDEQINTMYEFYTYVLYFDRVVPTKSDERTVEQIDELRQHYWQKQEEGFKENLLQVVNKNTIEIEQLFQKFQSDEFEIKLSNYYNIHNVQRVNLKYHIKFSMLYSTFAIEKAFHTGVINEDRLFIEYYLTTIQIMKDIIRGNFKRQYIVEFAETLFKKKQKLTRLLETIHNLAIQDKLSLKIKYKAYVENKHIVQDLMRDGYRFTVILDDTFSANVTSIERLRMFQFILLSKEAKYYSTMMENQDKLKNMIEI